MRTTYIVLCIQLGDLSQDVISLRLHFCFSVDCLSAQVRVCTDSGWYAVPPEDSVNLPIEILNDSLGVGLRASQQRRGKG